MGQFFLLSKNEEDVLLKCCIKYSFVCGKKGTEILFSLLFLPFIKVKIGFSSPLNIFELNRFSFFMDVT